LFELVLDTGKGELERHDLIVGCRGPMLGLDGPLLGSQSACGHPRQGSLQLSYLVDDAGLQGTARQASPIGGLPLSI
jgi:hypothetical protein